VFTGRIAKLYSVWNSAHQCPTLGIEAHGSAAGSGPPFCNNSIECRSGERTNAMVPSRGERLIVTPSRVGGCGG
jgi:hypothetical protein